MRDSLGQEIQMGDPVVFYRSKSFNLAIVTQIDDLKKTVTIYRPIFDIPDWRIPRNINIGLSKFTANPGELVVVHNANFHELPRLSSKRAWRAPDLTDATRFRQADIYNFIRANVSNPKIKLPPHLKNPQF